MVKKTPLNDTVGLVKTVLDVHTLGIATIDELLQQCGFNTVISDTTISKAFSNSRKADNASLIKRWIIDNNISLLGFSYRLNPEDAVLLFRQLMYQLENKGLLKKDGGPLKRVCFAGLPEACDRIKCVYKNNVGVFYGDETHLESLEIFGIDLSVAPPDIVERHPYDIALRDFGKEIIQKADYINMKPVDRHRAKNFGTKKEKLTDRINHGRENDLPPLIRSHAGPYLEDRKKAVELFTDWSRQLAERGFLDVLSIGTSQLTQERFGENWDDLPNGGGVPMNSHEEYRTIYNVSRPMLIRTYAGTKNIKELAGMYEDTINIAWHALSLWWFSRIDGRGQNKLLHNLEEHFDTIKYIAATGKPYESNVSHQFSFRSADDITYIVSVVLAARAAKKMGINDFILQIMLNDPKHTWGINDLAKARATLRLVRNLEDSNFRVYLQTRAGLDYFSHEPEKAKIQLAAVTALMDDIEPLNINSPDIIHVVSYAEGSNLATPEIIEESIKIANHSLDSYRTLKKNNRVDDMSTHSEVEERMYFLLKEAAVVLSAIEDCISDPYTPQGFYTIFKMGFLPVPQLMYCREEFPEAVRWQTKIGNGRVDVYCDEKIISATERMRFIKENLTVSQKVRIPAALSILVDRSVVSTEERTEFIKEEFYEKNQNWSVE